jgi:hypothetical protein
MSHSNHTSINKLSRAEIETLCVLHAVGPSGCWVGDLTARLGLSASLALVVAQGMERIVFSGLLERDEEWFRLTRPGREMLGKRLAELGLG